MMMYLVTAHVNDNTADIITHNIIAHHAQGQTVSQIFFYADAVSIGTQERYSDAIERLIEHANEHNVTLAICSAGFQKRNYHLSSNAEQDFSFKGLGQFVSDSHPPSIVRQFADNTIAYEPKNGTPRDVKYDTLIYLADNLGELLTKEFLDIALVSAAYDISTAVYMSHSCVTWLRKDDSVVIEQALSMVNEFSVPLLAATDDCIYGVNINKADYYETVNNSRLVYHFGNE